MKNLKCAMAIAAALGASSAVYATNTVQTQIGVTAYIAAGLEVTTTPLVLGAVVAPTGTTSPNHVEIECDGSVSYSSGGSPSGPGNSTQNATDPNPVTPAAGSIEIEGEPNYAVSVTVAPDAGLPFGVTFTPGIALDCTDATEDLSQAQLNATGDLDLVLFGLLEVDTNFDITGNQSIATNAIVTINYR